MRWLPASPWWTIPIAVKPVFAKNRAARPCWTTIDTSRIDSLPETVKPRNGTRAAGRGRLPPPPVWSGLVCSPAQDTQAKHQVRQGMSQDRSTTCKTRKRPGMRRSEGPTRQAHPFATDSILWKRSGKPVSAGSVVATNSLRTRSPATCFRGVASGILTPDLRITSWRPPCRTLVS